MMKFGPHQSILWGDHYFRPANTLYTDCNIFFLNSANDDSPKYPGKPLIIFEFNKSDQNAIQNASTELKQILTHKDVKTRNVSVISIISAFRKGKSFMLDYFLRFMYSNVSNLKTISLVIY